MADVEVACISPWLTSTVCTQFTGYGFVRRSLKHIRLIGSCFFSFFVPGERQKSTRISDQRVHLCQHLGAKLFHLRRCARSCSSSKTTCTLRQQEEKQTKPHSRTSQSQHTKHERPKTPPPPNTLCWTVVSDTHQV